MATFEMPTFEQIMAEKSDSSVALPKQDISALQLSECGVDIFRKCVGQSTAYEGGAWVVAASSFLEHFAAMRRRDGDIIFSACAKTLYLDLFPDSTETLNDQPREVQIAMAAVIRYWGNILNPDPTTPVSAKTVENETLAWAKGQLAKAGVAKQPQPRVTENGTYKEPVTNGQNPGVRVRTPEPYHVAMMQTHATESKTVAQSARELSGLRGCFTDAVRNKIEEYKRKIVSLERFAGNIDPECDEALWEIFRDVLKG